MGFHPSWDILFAGQSEPPANKGKQLSPAAVFVTVGFTAHRDRDDQRDKEAEQPKPCKQDIKKSQYQIGQRDVLLVYREMAFWVQ